MTDVELLPVQSGTSIEGHPSENLSLSRFLGSIRYRPPGLEWRASRRRDDSRGGCQLRDVEELVGVQELTSSHVEEGFDEVAHESHDGSGFAAAVSSDFGFFGGRSRLRQRRHRGPDLRR
jgi:hypothetical protein